MKLKFFTNKKIIFISIFLFLIITSSVPLYLFTSSFCKTYKIIYSVKDFGLNQINDCFSRYQMKQSVKEILRDYPLLYNLAASFKDKNIKDFELNKPPKSEDLINLPSDIEKPKNIVGLINNESNHRTDYKSFKKKTFDKWTRSHGDNYNLKFLNDNNINLDNIQNLKLFWSYSTIDDDYKFSDTSTHSPYILNKKNLKNKWKQNIQVNPIFLNGKLVFISADWKIVCVDIESKKVLWELQTIFPPSRRGIVAYTKNETDYLILPIGGKTYKIYLETGKRVKSFGENGSINTSTITSPIVDLEKNILIITNHRNKAVYKVNLDDGKIIKLIPLFDSKDRNFVGGTPWAGVAYDDLNKIIYIPTGNPQPSLYGVKRPGINFRSSSIIAVDLNKDKIIWTFQDVFHDLWDYDF